MIIQVEGTGVVAYIICREVLKGEACSCILQCAVQVAEGGEGDVKLVAILAPLDTKVKGRLKQLIIQRAEQMINRLLLDPNGEIIQAIQVHAG